jgi:hypothetical protein
MDARFLGASELLPFKQIHSDIVVPAKAAIQGERRVPGPWIPAFAGMTMFGRGDST